MSISMRIALNQKDGALGDFGAPRFAFDHIGAGEGNRTLVISLEGCRIALSDQHELILFLVRKPAFGAKVDTTQYGSDSIMCYRSALVTSNSGSPRARAPGSRKGLGIRNRCTSVPTVRCAPSSA